MTGRLEGKVAIVTGGGRGIGAGITRRFVEEGAKVAIVQRTAPRAEWPQDWVRFVQADLSRPAEIDAAVQQVARQFGGLDILVNNAGIMFEKTVDDMTEADWDLMLDINLKAPFLLIKSAIPFFRQRNSGAIVNIGSIEGWDRTLAIRLIPHRRPACTVSPRRSQWTTAAKASAATQSRLAGSIRTSARRMSRASLTAIVSAATCW
jgi:NAD(P)-dependent dehydrogenase (short-subunit alcohol dehydrogenase family)